MNKLILAASAAALLTAAGTVPALAQSSTAGASAMPMPMITCKDLSGMDQQTARNVVFYLSGLHAASGSTAMNSTTGSGSSSTTADAGSSGSTTGSSDTSGSGSTTADAGSSGSTTGSSDTSGSGSSSTTADSGSSGSSTDTTGSTTAAGSSSGSSDTTSSGGSSGMNSTVMAQLPGFSAINADQVISSCQSSPDKQLSEVMGSSSSTAQ